MNRQELATLIDNQFSAHVFDYSFTAKDSFFKALWPVLAQVWNEGHEAGVDDGRGTSAVWLEGEDRANPYRGRT